MKPKYDAEKRFSMAVSHHERGSYSQAGEIYKDLLGKFPANAMLLHYYGLLMHHTSNNEQAVNYMEKSLRVDSSDAEVWYNLGVVLQEMKKYEKAINAYKKSVSIDPKRVLGWNNLAELYRKNGDDKLQWEALQRAVEIDPNCALVLNSIALYYRYKEKYEDSEVYARRALAIEPKMWQAYIHIYFSCVTDGRYEEAIEALESALLLNSSLAAEHSCVLMSKHYSGELSREDTFSRHLKWAKQHEAPRVSSCVGHANERDPNKRLRIGYLSGDFREHSVVYFFLPLFRGLKERRVEQFCYSNLRKPDRITKMLEHEADGWCDTSDMDPEDLSRRIKDDEVDILIDLAGHSASNNLLACAYKPAPIQMTYLGYPDTTGMETIDYRISDGWADVVGDGDKFCSEHLLRVEGGFLCYQAASECPEVSDLPALKNGFVTFGSFNNPAKYSDKCIFLWSRVLKAAPGSMLVIKYRGVTDHGLKQRLLERFQRYGISSERITLYGHAGSYEEHMAMYSLVDVALDPIPYNGTTTTCEALWMGVPVVVLEGDRHVSRVGVSLLNSSGLSNWIGATEDEYIQKAIQLAENKIELAGIRAGLREKVADSMLTDSDAFAEKFSQILRKSWMQYCNEGDHELRAPVEG
ncbi:MAG: tetratricopeptide repeat protein [Gammaproteobacteria bacterium]|nr:tetratricopeptide repeat protein [Gammaproteobacteria bacterium]